MQSKVNWRPNKELPVVNSYSDKKGILFFTKFKPSEIRIGYLSDNCTVVENLLNRDVRKCQISVAANEIKHSQQIIHYTIILGWYPISDLGISAEIEKDYPINFNENG